MTDENDSTTTSSTGDTSGTTASTGARSASPTSTSAAATPPPSDDAPTKVGKRQLPQMNMDTAKIRTTLAKIVWLVCALFALILAAAVLLVAIDANTSNELVKFIGETSDKIDFGLFDLSDPIKDFNEKVPNFSDTGTVFFNYGLAAIAWLVIGRIADRLIRP